MYICNYLNASRIKCIGRNAILQYQGEIICSVTHGATTIAQTLTTIHAVVTTIAILATVAAATDAVVITAVAVITIVATAVAVGIAIPVLATAIFFGFRRQ